jgi:hypothetical protein
MANNFTFLVNGVLSQPNLNANGFVDATTTFVSVPSFYLSSNKFKGNTTYMTLGTGLASNVYQLLGTAKTSTTSNTIVGYGTAFDTELIAGDRIYVTGFTGDTVVRVHSISGAQTMIVTPKPSATIAVGASIYVRKLGIEPADRLRIADSGLITTLKSLTVGRNLSIVGNTTISQNLTVIGNTNIQGTINLGDATSDLLTVSGRATIAKNLNVSGNTFLKNLKISANTIVPSLTLFANTKARAILTPTFSNSIVTTVSLNTSNTIQLTGLVKTTSTSNTIVGQGTTFTAELSPGNRIAITGQSTIVRVHSITSAQTMIVTPRPSASITTGANAYIRILPTLVPTVNFLTSGTISDSIGNVRDMVSVSKSSAYTLTAADSGKMIKTTANVAINSSILSADQRVYVYNNSAASITLVQGAGVTLRLSGTATTGNRTLAQRGYATILMVSGTEAVTINGGGLT